MSIETDAEDAATVTAEDPEALARELGAAISELPEYQRFEEAKAAVEDDEETQEKISEFEQLRQEFALAQQTGRADNEAVQKVQEAQEELHSMPLMAEYLDAQDELEARLETLNELISEPLSVDFGGEAGGCCKD
jgi:cell fate (sporulation/competence/biofilm development) regulator YlbF (YheA/YmcA/DUF963 family)